MSTSRLTDAERALYDVNEQSSIFADPSDRKLAKSANCRRQGKIAKARSELDREGNLPEGSAEESTGSMEI